MKLACVDCHKDVKSLAHETPPQKVLCADCHADAKNAYAHSTHAKIAAAGKTAANCQDCHGGAHEVLAGGDPDSPVNHANIPYHLRPLPRTEVPAWSPTAKARRPSSPTRTACTVAPSKTARRRPPSAPTATARTTILAANDAKSPISKFNVPATCGKCHADITQTFNAQHSRAGHRARQQLSPVCTDCHGIHSIKSHNDPNSPVAEQNRLARYLRPLP